ncbi:MAG TPA: hypothetical protein VGH23_04400 [Rhizomicrobium sp.]|jgi:hypothetical protein
MKNPGDGTVGALATPRIDGVADARQKLVDVAELGHFKAGDIK